MTTGGFARTRPFADSIQDSDPTGHRLVGPNAGDENGVRRLGDSEPDPVFVPGRSALPRFGRKGKMFLMLANVTVLPPVCRGVL